MSLIAQAAVLLGVCFAAEAAVRLLNLPVPGNVLGMALLFALLCARIVKPEQIKRVSNALLSNMTALFVPSAAALMVHYRAVSGHWPGFLAAIVFSSLLTFAVTGWLADLFLRGKNE